MERLVNLAFFFASTGGTPVTAERIRTEVAGYPSDQDDATFLRMFERDKDQLRRMGLALDADEQGNYVLDRAGTFASEFELTDAEAAAIRTAGAALLDDPSFPFTEELRLALAKVSAEVAGPAPSAARLADEDPGRQGELVGALNAAASDAKRVSFGYTNSRGESAVREVEPYGLFLHDGRWYVVGRDVAKDDVRTYAVSRMDSVEVNAAKPKTPDFERPEGFSIATYLLLPFQYGTDEFEAVLKFEPPAAWRADALSAGRGRLKTHADGSVTWQVPARSARRLLRFALEHGPGISVTSPQGVADELAAGLREVASAHA